jgi:hypothetical protein
MTVKIQALESDEIPPEPVSFFDSSLKETRQLVFYQWTRTGE